MKRVLVIGSSGAGKSTFSRRLHEVTRLKLIHLDRLYWKANWVEPADKVEWRKNLAEVLKDDEWIIDGNYGSTLELRLQACDTAILLDFPHYVCAWRVLKRIVIYRKGGRPDMAEGCNERFDWEFIKWTWTYPKRSMPRVESLLEKYGETVKVIRLKSNRDVEDFFARLKSN